MSTRGRLAEAGGQHAAHHHFVDLPGFQARALNGGFDRDRTELRRGQRSEVALKCRHRRAGNAHDDDRISVCLTHVSAP
jgi:hypothetical protein